MFAYYTRLEGNSEQGTGDRGQGTVSISTDPDHCPLFPVPCSLTTLEKRRGIAYNVNWFRDTGEVSERLKEHAWKACVPCERYRGFKSHPLRNSRTNIFE